MGTAGRNDSDAGVVADELKLVVSPSQGARPISPYIYGVNYGANGVAPAAAVKAPLVRLGGNDLSEYNWEIDATNGGKLQGFSNKAMSGTSATGVAVTQVLQAAAANGGAAHVTVPIGDNVAADSTAGDVHASGADYLTKRFRKNKAQKGSALSASPDLSDDSVYQDEFISWVKAKAGNTPVFFSLDNQPDLWTEDHTDTHPDHATYADVIARNIAYAKMIKSTWPGAQVTGYTSYGWQGFLNLQNAPDASKGEFITYYLDQMKAAEDTNGGRLIDYLDIHWWPEAQGGGVRVIQPDSGPDVQVARLDAPRSLWDTTYTEKSWIADTLSGSSDTIHLIPRARGWIGDHYPGTKLAISAWYYGGGGDISGAIATADALGIFGREGVDLAAVDLSTGDDSFTLAGFHAFLDFDGTGRHFGDTSVKATASDATGFSIYASTDSADPTRMVIVALNKRLQSQNAVLTIDGATYGSCAVYGLDSTSAALAANTPLTATTPGTFSYKVPGRSITVLVPGQ